MKNKLIILCILTMLLGTVSAPVSASASYFNDTADSQYYEISETRIEETKWYYRIVDDRLQHRLWSITNMVWLTEWEWIS